MQVTDIERAAAKRHNATQRTYRTSGTGDRFKVKAIEPGRKYHVYKGASVRVTVWADSCDNAMTNYLRNN